MDIANPIYDAVFKFMMEDKKVASLFIGAVTGYDVQDVELRPTEVITDAEGMRQWTVYRLDLAVRVRTDDGSRLVLVEIQKAKYHTDIQRFRGYLGRQYASQQNFETITRPDGSERKVALPIFTIYILGHCLAHNRDVPVITVNRTYTDRATGQNLTERDEFIESLTHDSAIIQVPALKERRRDRLEQFLAVFDQAQINPDDHHLLRVNDADYPEECRIVLRRLHQAISEEQVRQKMIVEDEIVSEFEERDRREQRLADLAGEERRLREEAQTREAEARQREAEARTREEDARRREQEERLQREEACRRVQEERRQKDAALAEIAALQRALEEKGQ
jgi:hypothetical protein